MIHPKVNIILATYNGGRFLKEQLDSLINQTYNNISIYIRDDGSTDNTIDIINEYISNNSSSKEIILLNDNAGNLRCPGSFYKILNDCDSADYYAFCDQDDIWYEDKIKWAVEKLEQRKKQNKDDSIPIVYYSGYEYYTDGGEFIRHSSRQNENPTVNDVIYYTPASGFVLVFNEAARQQFIVNVDPGKELHDRWLLRCAITMGQTIYDPRYTATHIRHAEAVTADNSSNKNLIVGFVKKEIMGQEMIEAKKNLIHFCNVFQDRLNSKDRKILNKFTKKNSPIAQLQKLLYPHRLRPRMAGEIALRFIFLFGRC